MKKLGFALVAALSFSVLGVTGCGGGGEPTVIEVDDAAASDSGDAMEGISDEEYNRQMEQSMQNQGN